MAGTSQLALAVRLINEAKGDMAKLDKDLAGIDERAKKGHGSLGKMGGALGDVAKIAGGFVIAQGLLKLPGLFGGMMDSASAFNETLSKSNTVFKDNAKEIEAWANGAAQGFGQSKQQALDAASSFGNMFVQLGIGSGVAASMSQNMTELASDFASFHNADISEVINAQTAAFRGEYDALQRFVPTINAAAVEQEALAQTGKKTTKELTAQDKALATNTLMMKGAGDAMGDFDRTSDGAANKARILDARLADMSATLGQKLLPMKVELMRIMLDYLLPAFERFADWVGPKLSAAIDLVAPKLSILSGFTWQALKDAGEFIRDVVVPAAGALWEKLEPVGKFLEKGFEFAWGALKDAFEFIRDVAVPAAADLAEKGLDKIREKLSMVDWTPMTDALGKARDYIADINKEDMGGWWDAFAKKMKPAIDFLKPFVEDLLDAWLDQFRALKPAFEDLAKALEPFMPLLKPIAEIIGVTLVLAIALVMKEMELFIRAATLGFVAAIKVVELALIALWKAWEIGVTIWEKVVEGFNAGLDVFKKAWDDPIGFLAGMMVQIFGIAKGIGSAILNGIKQGIEDGWDAFKGWITGKLDPRNWDIPGLSPFLDAYEHAGIMAGDKLMKGVAMEVSANGPAVSAALSASLIGPGGLSIPVPAGVDPAVWIAQQYPMGLDNLEMPWGSVGPQYGGGSFAGGGGRGASTIIVNINALDAKSIIDRGPEIREALARATTGYAA